jgi:hypothetical protein
VADLRAVAKAVAPQSVELFVFLWRYGREGWAALSLALARAL